MKELTSKLLAILLFQTSQCLAGYLCTNRNEICVTGTSQNGVAQFSITSKTPGWIAIGLSADGTMTKSDAMMVWKKSTGAMGVSDNYQSTHSGTSIDTQQDVTGVGISTDSSGAIIYNISRALNTNDPNDIAFTPGQAQYWILVGCSSLPSGTPPRFQQHTYTYAYNVDLLTAAGNNTDLNPGGNGSGLPSTLGGYSSFAGAHGILMVAVWSFLMPIAIIMARSFKFLGPIWFRVHWGLAALSVILMIISFALIASQVSQQFASPHTIYGAIVILMTLLVQIPFGIYIDRAWNPNRKEIPFHDKAHAWIGRVLLIFTLITAYTGFEMFGSDFSIEILWLLWMFIVLPGFAWVAHSNYGGRAHPTQPNITQTAQAYD